MSTMIFTRIFTPAHCRILLFKRYTKDNDQDGTSGEQPRGTILRGNVARELGIFQLQSSMFFQAKTAMTTIEGNLFFNGPRAGINL
jgi:hypothetical protein